MAYYFGKGANAGFDWGRKKDRDGAGERADEPSPLDPRLAEPSFFPSVTPGIVTPSLPSPLTPSVVSPVVTPSPAPGIEGEGVGGYDALLDMLFGKEFETIRGIGGRSRESVYDALAREGMLGTGAMKGVASDVAWQTERGVTDLIRNMAQMRKQEEDEAMNLMLTYMAMMQQGWQG